MDIGGYSIIRRLGAGGMGEVFLARQEAAGGLGRAVVVKTVTSRLTGDREHAQRFLDEARLAIQLRHKNICGVSNVGAVDGNLFLVMDYVAGRDLRDILQALADRGLELAARAGLYVLREMLEGLDYAHRFADPRTGAALGIVHRDVSPSNVMVSVEGEVQIIDFGHALSTWKEERTDAGTLIGKVAYMSPEQARGEVVDAQSDVYSAGIVGTELLAGRRFYDSNDPAAVRDAARRGARSTALDEVDPAIRTVLEQMLAPDPQTRLSAGGAAREIDRLLVARGEVARAADLRALMKELFPDELARQRELVTAALDGASETASAETVVLFSQLEAMSATAPSAGELTQRVRVRARDTFTERLPERRPPRIAALAAGLVVVAAVVVIAWAASRTQAPDGPAAGAGAGPVARRAAPSVVDAGAGADAYAGADAGADADDTATGDAPAGDAPADDAGGEGDALDADPTALELVAPSDDGPRARRPHHTHRRVLRTTRDKLQFLGKCKQRCAPTVVDNYKDFGALSVDEARGLAAELETCVKRCGG